MKKRIIIIVGIIILILASGVIAGIIGYNKGVELPIGGTEIKTNEKIIVEE